MALTFQNILPVAGRGTWSLTFSVPANFIPAALADGMLTIVSSAGASAETVYAVEVSAATNGAISANTIPSGATTVLFSDNNWTVLK
jgi:hypothetical protein